MVMDPEVEHVDYIWKRGSTTPKNLRWALRSMEDRAFTAQWAGTGGAIIDRSVSELELECWQIRAWDTETLDEVASFVSQALAPLAAEKIKLHPVYRDVGPSYVGWLFWHRKETKNAHETG